MIGLQETKLDGTSEIVADGYRFYFSADDSGIKGRKGQPRVNVFEKSGKDGIANECINERHLNFSISIK